MQDVRKSGAVNQTRRCKETGGGGERAGAAGKNAGQRPKECGRGVNRGGGGREREALRRSLAGGSAEGASSVQRLLGTSAGQWSCRSARATSNAAGARGRGRAAWQSKDEGGVGGAGKQSTTTAHLPWPAAVPGRARVAWWVRDVAPAAADGAKTAACRGGGGRGSGRCCCCDSQQHRQMARLEGGGGLAPIRKFEMFEMAARWGPTPLPTVPSPGDAGSRQSSPPTLIVRWVNPLGAGRAW